MDEKIIHRVYLTRGHAGQTESLSVTDLWLENQEAPEVFRCILTRLVNDHIYDDSDDPDTHCFYTASDSVKIKEAVEAWYARPDIEHNTETDSWYENIIYA